MTTDDLPAILARVRELDAAATKGPWRAMRDGNSRIGNRVVAQSRIEEVPRPHSPAYLGGPRPMLTLMLDNDADLVSEYRTAAPLLAAALEAAMAENERLRAELEMIRDAAADAIRDNEHVGFTVRTLHALRSIKLEETR